MGVLKPDEGGRSKPFFSGYRPQCFIRTADTATDVQLPADMQMAMPGDNLTAHLKLNVPLPIVQGQRFALREWKDCGRWCHHKTARRPRDRYQGGGRAQCEIQSFEVRDLLTTTTN